MWHYNTPFWVLSFCPGLLCAQCSNQLAITHWHWHSHTQSSPTDEGTEWLCFVVVVHCLLVAVHCCCRLITTDKQATVLSAGDRFHPERGGSVSVAVCVSVYVYVTLLVTELSLIVSFFFFYFFKA